MGGREVGDIGLPDRERKHHESEEAEEKGGPRERETEHLSVCPKRI